MQDAPQKYYEENPYQVDVSRGGEERMSVVRAALTLSLGIIISVGIIVLFLHHKDRFTIVPQNQGIFVFDYKNSSISFCNAKECALISVNADHYQYPSRETYFMPQGYMNSSPQYPMGFMSPQAMQQNPYMNPQYPPYMQSPYPPQQYLGPQPGWVGFPPQQTLAAPIVPAQQQQVFQEQLVQPQQEQLQQIEQPLDQAQPEVQQEQQLQEQEQPQQ